MQSWAVNDMIIAANKLTKKYTTGAGDFIALSGVDLAIPQGQFVAITGRSGSGKSTLLYQLGVLDHPTSGTLMIDNTDIGSLNQKQRTEFRRVELGYIFQDYATIPSLTALENIMVPLLMQNADLAHARAQSEQALEKVGLKDKMHSLPAQLSGGQQQRVSIARAIAHSPKIIFADEPTANLDTETSKVILDLFLELNREGQTIVMVTHEQEYADLAHRIIELSDGKIVNDTLKR